MNKENTALLVMDYQVSIVMGMNLTDERLAAAADAMAAAREAGIPVIHVMVGFRPSHPEVAETNKGFMAAKTGDRLVLTDPGTAIHPAVAPLEGEIVITKKRISAFCGSDLQQVLKAGRIETLVLMGLSTSGVVLSTVRQAADLDYRLVVIGECCADRDAEVHRVLTEKVFAMQADTVTLDQFKALIK